MRTAGTSWTNRNIFSILTRTLESSNPAASAPALGYLATILLPMVCGHLALGCACQPQREDGSGSASAATVTDAAPRPTPAPHAHAPASVAPLRPAGSAAPTPPIHPRIYARSRFVWIWPRPDTTSQWIGFLWLGGSAPLRSAEPIPGIGCARFVAIEPQGYVCVDEQKATLDADDPYLNAVRPYAPQVHSPWPHHYGESIGLERFAHVPDEEHQRMRERDYTYHKSRVANALGGEVADDLLGIDFTPATAAPVVFPDPPRGMHEPRSDLKRLSTVAWSTEAFAYGRSWLLSADLMWVPKDRVKVYPKVTFHGVRLGEHTQLPIALFRKEARPVYERRDDGSFAPSGSHYQRLSWVALNGKSETVTEDAGDRANVTYLQTVDGRWVREDQAVVPSPRETTPWGARVGAVDDTGQAPQGRQTWLEVSIWGGWLLAFEGTKPVYATLISPGRGGPPIAGKDPLSTASTPTGRFKITGKFKTATMEAPGEYIHSDVPWTQNFSGPHALHGAYWHDDWGQLKSAGCINVSPEDGKWLFAFTEPDVPDGWHGVRWLPSLQPATTLIVHP